MQIKKKLDIDFDILCDLFKSRISVDDASEKLGLTTEKINELIDKYSYVSDLEDIKKVTDLFVENLDFTNDVKLDMQIKKKLDIDFDISTDEIIKQKNNCIFIKNETCIGNSGEIKCLFCNKCVLDFEDVCQLIKMERNDDFNNIKKIEFELDDEKQMRFDLDGGFKLDDEKQMRFDLDGGFKLDDEKQMRFDLDDIFELIFEKSKNEDN